MSEVNKMYMDMALDATMASMQSLREVLNDARKKKVAVGHFNISDSSQFNAIVGAAKELGVPVIIGVSEGERKFVGLENAMALVRAARERATPVYLNADHTHDVEECKRAIDAGFDSVIYDGTKVSDEENRENTKAVVTYARESGRDIIVEAELGYIGTSSKMLDDVPEDVVLDALPSAEDAKAFVGETGVDALAPAVGNLHGMLKGRSNPSLKIDLIKEMRTVLPETTFVLHGGSGLIDDDFVNAIESGMNCVHINTEIRRAYREGIEKKLAENPEEIAPYRYLDEGALGVKKIVTERLKLFSRL